MRRMWSALALVLVMASSAAAQPSVGFQAGGSIDPEQFFAGVYWQSPELGGRFAFRSGLDGGFGSDLRIATINVDFLFYFPLGGTNWSLVQGGGPTVVITRYGFGEELDETDVGAGGSYVIGFAHERGFFTEARIGSGRVPSLKFGAGWRIEF
jgi:hypothetical protein